MLGGLIVREPKNIVMKTTNRLFLALALLFSVQLVSAQVKVNPRVGLNVSALDAKLTDFTAEARAGWNAGMDFRIGQGTIFLHPGIHYYSNTTRLVQDINTETEVRFSEETTIQSFKAPLNLGLRVTGDNGLLGLYLHGGVVPTSVMGVKEVDNIPFDIDKLNRLTWGANAGVGLDFLFLTANLSYEHGLTEYFVDGEGRNNVVTLSVGLKF